MSAGDAQTIRDQLSVAACQVEPASDREPWDYGWHLKGYRRSERAALTGSHGPVTLTSQGLAAFEEAVTMLLREGQVHDRWNPEELWGIVGSLVVAASEEIEVHAELLKRGVHYLRRGSRTLTVQLVANVTWGRPPLGLGAAVVGNADAEFLKFVNSSARGRMRLTDEQGERWLEGQVRPRLIGKDVPVPVAIACWTVGQRALAWKESERQLRSIADLALLLERDLSGHDIFSRGDVNRPGIRGIALDRGAIDRNLRGPARIELAAFPWTVTAMGDGSSAHWFGVEPLPLGALLEQHYLRDAVQSCLKEDPISKRVRVAARWFAEAHYTSAGDDAALALGVAMDALLTGQNSLPGSAMADRFALLANDPMMRPKLVGDYLDFYKVRSSVAHGGRSGRLDSQDFIKDYSASVHWAAWRSLALRDSFGVSSEKEVDSLFNDLRWGVRSWGSANEL